MNSPPVDEILELSEECDEAERVVVFQALRRSIKIHGLEDSLGVSAEIILEAISRASDLTQRGVRGVIAEAVFGTSVATALSGWTSELLQNDFPYDYKLVDAIGEVRVQVKMQRRERGSPKLVGGFYVVETQKTRGGTDAEGKGTRPYRFGEFDLIAACMQASSGNWSDFMYSVGRWLIASKSDPTCLQVFQYIPVAENDDWTADFIKAVGWLRSNVHKTIKSPSHRRPAKAAEPSRRKRLR